MGIESIIKLVDWQWINDLTGKKVENLFYKSDTDWTTEIDLAIEQHLLSVIEKVAPKTAIVSEEAFEAKGLNISKSDAVDQPLYRWFVDPLDGTYNLTLGLPYFGIQLCCWDLSKNEPLSGLIYIPKLGELIAWDSQMPQGLYQIWDSDDGKFISTTDQRINTIHDLSHSLVDFGDFSSSNKISRPFQGRLIQCLSAVTGKIRLHGSSATDFHFLCTGRSQAYILFTKRPWEIYPGLALAKGFGLGYECLHINSSDYEGPLWLIAHKAIFEDLKAIILAL